VFKNFAKIEQFEMTSTNRRPSQNHAEEETSLLPNDDSAPLEPIKDQLRFPPSVFYILGTEFCERFSYYGTSAILYVYLTRYQGFEDNSATARLVNFFV
jgi:hypothetical protein